MERTPGSNVFLWRVSDFPLDTTSELLPQLESLQVTMAFVRYPLYIEFRLSKIRQNYVCDSNS